MCGLWKCIRNRAIKSRSSGAPGAVPMSLPVVLPSSCCPLGGPTQRPRGARTDSGASERPLPGRPLLSLGALQLLLGGSMVALSYGALSLSSSAPITHSCPMWAGASVILSGIVGILTWRRPVLLMVNAFVLLSVLSVLLSLAGFVLCCQDAQMVSNMSSCTQVGDSCLCCLVARSSKCPEDEVVEMKPTQSCSNMKLLLKKMLFALCALNAMTTAVCLMAAALRYLRLFSSRTSCLQEEPRRSVEGEEPASEPYPEDFVAPAPPPSYFSTFYSYTPRLAPRGVIPLPHIYGARIKGVEVFCPLDPPPPYEEVEGGGASAQGTETLGASSLLDSPLLTPRTPPTLDSPLLTPRAPPTLDYPLLTPRAPPSLDYPLLTPRAPPSLDSPLLTPRAPPSLDSPLLTPRAPPTLDSPLLTPRAPPSLDSPLLTPRAPPSLDSPLLTPRAPPTLDSPLLTPRAPPTLDSPLLTPSVQRKTGLSRSSSDPVLSEDQAKVDSWTQTSQLPSPRVMLRRGLPPPRPRSMVDYQKYRYTQLLVRRILGQPPPTSRLSPELHHLLDSIRTMLLSNQETMEEAVRSAGVMDQVLVGCERRSTPAETQTFPRPPLRRTALVHLQSCGDLSSVTCPSLVSLRRGGRRRPAPRPERHSLGSVSRETQL